MTAPRRPALDVISHSPEQTRRIGTQLGRVLDQGSLVLLGGMIGAGKTTFAQGLARGLRVSSEMLSPTFTLVSEHEGVDASERAVRIYHIDLYRIEDGDELLSVGFEEYLDDPNAVTIVEWPERARAMLPDEYISIEFSSIADTKRGISVDPHGERYQQAIEKVRRELAGARG